ncbi:primase-like DNA-binding domain-containing protein [Psychrobacillus sp. FSL K6-1464]|uniref:primase-like DNA-binding domain-containing protein n=1 Tax=Psychrobacillus sp. FSL K6-1464 TaxID=2921545 RepID=UPI0030FB495E
MDWLENGLQCPSSVKSATEEYREEMDVVNRFLNDCFDINPLAKVSFKEIYAKFKIWAHDNGENEMSGKALGGSLIEREFVPKGISGQRFYVGLSLRKDE